jgi:hypothetical protein
MPLASTSLARFTEDASLMFVSPRAESIIREETEVDPNHRLKVEH